MLFLTFFRSDVGKYINRGNSENLTVKDFQLNSVSVADTIFNLIDTGFYAEYRVKPDVYLFNYLRGGNMGSELKFKPEVEAEISRILRLNSIRRIWRDDVSNYIHFQYYFDDGKFRNVFVSKNNSDSLVGPDFEKIDLRILDSGQSIKVGYNRSLLKVESRLFLMQSLN